MASPRRQILSLATSRFNRLPLSVGHRGASEQWPENSILSMGQAVKDGADGLEGDLHLTSDGEIIVMHDPSLDRTTDGTGLIKDRPWRGYIDGLRSKKEPHVPVPRCLDVLAFLAQEGNEKVWWIIDVKMNNTPALFFSKFVKLIEDNFPGRDFSSQIVLGLWHPKFLTAADKYLPKFSRVHVGFSLEIAREHFPPHTVDGYNMNFMVLTTVEGRLFIREMQAAGKQVLAWTVNDTIEARECVRMGIDYVLTDRTKVLGKVLQEYESLGKEVVDKKYEAEVFNTWSRWFRYAFWRTLIWMFLTVKFRKATEQLDFATPEESQIKSLLLTSSPMGSIGDSPSSVDLVSRPALSSLDVPIPMSPMAASSSSSRITKPSTPRPSISVRAPPAPMRSSSHSPVPTPSPTLPRYSVLVLGKSQVGKSALLEHFRNYSVPNEAIDHTRLGDGVFSKTEIVNSVLVKSNLPSYEVYYKTSGTTIDLNSLGKGVNAEDFQDLLLLREDDVDLRLVPDGLNGPEPDEMEFEIIDTPGMCNHQGKDREHALNIIDAMMSSQPFKLILVVVNIHDPFDAELLLAFQYYSKILDGLHSNIAFLYTHTDYCVLANPGQQNALASKTLFLSRVFRTLKSGDTEIYPSFTIDLTEKRLPVMQSMIRNTLKDILQLAASNLAVLMDKRTTNIKRIKRIGHPSEFDDLQRDMALESMYREPQLQTKHRSSPPSLPISTVLQSINILLIGDAQSGKSSLINSMKQYADPLSVTKVEFFSKGENGATEDIITGYSFVADLHTIQILMNGKTLDDRIINIKQEAETLSYQEFADLISMEHDNISTCVVRPSVSRKYQFSIFEVPGWQEDIGSPLDKAAAIHRAISKSNKEFHQVLVTLGSNAITNATETVISRLVNMVPTIVPLLAFVHTKINYRNLHVSNIAFHNYVMDKKGQLQGLIRTNPPIFFIDNHFDMSKPVQCAISLNTIHDILLAATKSNPKYSVLVLGKTQSGKSSLVQHIKRYADPAYLIDQSLLGDGNTSKTESTEQFFIYSDLPAYEVIKLATGAIIDVQNLHARTKNEDDYHEALLGRETQYELRMVPQNPHQPPSQLVEFRFLDTPGINDTDHRDDVFAADIIHEVIATRSFNLILVAVSAESHLSMEYGFALEYYAKVLQGLHANIAFLYTHIDYANCHHTNTKHKLSMMTRHNAFSRIFRDLRYLPMENPDGSDAEEMEYYRRFTIDLHSKKRPVIQCMIRNTLRDILQLAVASPPVDLDTSQSNIDRIRTLVHPDKSNRAYRERFLVEMQAKVPLEEESEEEEEEHMSLEDEDVERIAAYPAIMTWDSSDFDYAGYFPATGDESVMDDDDENDSLSDLPEAKADPVEREE